MIPATWTTRPLQMFRGAPQVENFRSLGSIYPVRVIRRARTQSPLERGLSNELPKQFSFQGQTLQTERFLEEMETTGLIVLKDDESSLNSIGSATMPPLKPHLGL